MIAIGAITGYRHQTIDNSRGARLWCIAVIAAVEQESRMEKADCHNRCDAQMRRAFIVFMTKLVSMVSTHFSFAILSLMKRS